MSKKIKLIFLVAALFSKGKFKVGDAELMWIFMLFFK